PNAIDTSQYAGWYVYWNRIPISNGFGTSLVVGDVNKDGRAEVYGDYRIDLFFQSRIYQIDSGGNPSLVYIYDPRPGVARDLLDADGDSLAEIAFSFSGLISDFEQSTLTG